MGYVFLADRTLQQLCFIPWKGHHVLMASGPKRWLSCHGWSGPSGSWEGPGSQLYSNRCRVQRHARAPDEVQWRAETRRSAWRSLSMVRPESLRALLQVPDFSDCSHKHLMQHVGATGHLFFPSHHRTLARPFVLSLKRRTRQTGVDTFCPKAKGDARADMSGVEGGGENPAIAFDIIGVTSPTPPTRVLSFPVAGEGAPAAGCREREREVALAAEKDAFLEEGAGVSFPEYHRHLCGAVLFVYFFLYGSYWCGSLFFARMRGRPRRRCCRNRPVSARRRVAMETSIFVFARSLAFPSFLVWATRLGDERGSTTLGPLPPPPPPRKKVGRRVHRSSGRFSELASKEGTQ